MPKLQTYKYSDERTGANLVISFADDSPSIDRDKLVYLTLLKQAVTELTAELGSKIVDNN